MASAVEQSADQSAELDEPRPWEDEEEPEYWDLLDPIGISNFFVFQIFFVD